MLRQPINNHPRRIRNPHQPHILHPVIINPKPRDIPHHLRLSSRPMIVHKHRLFPQHRRKPRHVPHLQRLQPRPLLRHQPVPHRLIPYADSTLRPTTALRSPGASRRHCLVGPSRFHRAACSHRLARPLRLRHTPTYRKVREVRHPCQQCKAANPHHHNRHPPRTTFHRQPPKPNSHYTPPALDPTHVAAK